MDYKLIVNGLDYKADKKVIKSIFFQWNLAPYIVDSVKNRLIKIGEELGIGTSDLETPRQIRSFIKKSYKRMKKKRIIKEKVEQVQQGFAKVFNNFSKQLEKVFDNYNLNDPKLYCNILLAPGGFYFLKRLKRKNKIKINAFTEIEKQKMTGSHETIHIWWFNYMREKQPQLYKELGKRRLSKNNLDPKRTASQSMLWYLSEIHAPAIQNDENVYQSLRIKGEKIDILKANSLVDERLTKFNQMYEESKTFDEFVRKSGEKLISVYDSLKKENRLNRKNLVAGLF